MKDNKWIRDMDENTLKYILGLQEINKSLIKTLEIYGQLLRKVKSENENHGEIEKAIENIENVIASASKLHFLHEITLH